MSTYIDFVQPSGAPFSWQQTLDGNLYTISVPWNLYGQRYYVLVQDQSGNVVVNLPRIGSPLTYDINLLAGYFVTSTLVWRENNDQFEVGP